MSKHNRGPIFLVLAFLLLALLFYLFAERWLRALLLYLSGAGWARSIVTSFPPAWYVASRFVAGEAISDAIQTSRELNARGMATTMDFLGESVTERAEAVAACGEILNLLDEIDAARIEAGVSVKLSQLGVNIDDELALTNMRAIMARARSHGIFVRIDMEESQLVDTTLRIFRLLRHEDGYDNVGVVIQAYLYRSEADVRELVTDGATVRLCKGAYMEPPNVAYPDKDDTDDNFVRLMKILLSDEARVNGVYPAIATHDEAMIDATIEYAERHNVRRDMFEFQLLFGVRRELQQTLVDDGFRVRIYVPYGTAWYPYFMRRLAERPANLWFFLSNLIRR